jgi:hypothetical protein
LRSIGLADGDVIKNGCVGANLPPRKGRSQACGKLTQEA